MPKVERIDLAHLLADAWRWHAINDTMAVNAGHGEVDAPGWLTRATGVDRDASALGHRMLKAAGEYDTASGRAADLLEPLIPAATPVHPDQLTIVDIGRFGAVPPGGPGARLHPAADVHVCHVCKGAQGWWEGDEFWRECPDCHGVGTVER